MRADSNMVRKLVVVPSLDGRFDDSTPVQTSFYTHWRKPNPWEAIHSHDGCGDDFLPAWESTIPRFCRCIEEYQSIKKRMPPKHGSSLEFFCWGNELHNEVNANLRRANPHLVYDDLTVTQALQMWRHATQPKSERLVITVATGQIAKQTLKLTEPLMQTYSKKCNADFIKLTNETEPWWGFEKFRVRHFGSIYEEVFFVDADVVIKPNCPNIFEIGLPSKVAMHDDYPMLRSADWLHNERNHVLGTQGWAETGEEKLCLNSGVVFTKNAIQTWERPTDALPSSHCSEQIVVEKHAKDLGFDFLDRRWNNQAWMTDFWDFEPKAYIMHFANDSNRLANIRKYVDSLHGG